MDLQGLHEVPGAPVPLEAHTFWMCVGVGPVYMHEIMQEVEVTFFQSVRIEPVFVDSEGVVGGGAPGRLWGRKMWLWTKTWSKHIGQLTLS